MDNKEMLEEIKDVAEVIILNVREDMQDEIQKIDKKLDRLIEILEKIV